MLAQLAAGLVLLTFQQDPTPPPIENDPTNRVEDVVVISSPETILCVRQERPQGSRIQGAGECRSIAAWRTIQVARADRYKLLMKYNGKYVGDSSLEEEALSQMVSNRLDADNR